MTQLKEAKAMARDTKLLGKGSRRLMPPPHVEQRKAHRDHREASAWGLASACGPCGDECEWLFQKSKRRPNSISRGLEEWLAPRGCLVYVVASERERVAFVAKLSVAKSRSNTKTPVRRPLTGYSNIDLFAPAPRSVCVQ